MLTLPSLLGQSDRDFRTVVLTSPKMPAVYLQRLRGLCARLPGAEALVSEENDVEDALSVKFRARLLQNPLRLRLFPVYALSLSTGLILNNWDGEPVGMRLTENSFMSVGTAARLPDSVSIFHRHHRKLARRYRAMMDRRQVSFPDQRWSNSDSDQGPGQARSHERQIRLACLMRVIEQEFPFPDELDLSLLQAGMTPSPDEPTFSPGGYRPARDFQTSSDQISANTC